jgi:release factor glutamine methyltransferase
VSTSTIAVAVRDAERRIAESGVGDTSKLDAELLVGHVTGKDRVRLRIDSEVQLTVDQQLELAELVIRRAAGEPIAYLTGTAWFYGRAFAVDARVLVPRPETELLVELALEHVARWMDADAASTGGAPIFVADVCTGSGCVGVSIAAELASRYDEGEVRVACSDISDDALEVARINADAHAPDVLLREGDLLRPIADVGPFVVIVTNPPYVASEWDEGLDPGVRAHEPHVALFAPSWDTVSGLYERLARQAMDALEPSGMFAVEHGMGQRALVQDILRRVGFVDVTGVDDLAGVDRVVTGTAPSMQESTDVDALN